MIKEEIRKINKLKRSQMTKEEVFEKSRKIADTFISSTLYKKASVIMLYYPLGNEADTRLLFNRFFSDSKTLLLPITRNDIITPVKISENTEYILGDYNICEPKNASVFPKEKIDVIIIPGIAFDRHGSRVGFGKGCFDRFLEETNAVKIGYCYDFQICENIKTQDFDINMDFLVTESELIVCE